MKIHGYIYTAKNKKTNNNYSKNIHLLLNNFLTKDKKSNIINNKKSNVVENQIEKKNQIRKKSNNVGHKHD